MPTVTVEYHYDTLILCNRLGFVVQKKKKEIMMAIGDLIRLLDKALGT